MMITDRIQPSPAPGDLGRGNSQWYIKQGVNQGRGAERIVLNVQGHSFKRRGENGLHQHAGYGGAGVSSTLDRSKKNKNSGEEPPLVIRSSTRLLAADMKANDFTDNRNTSSLGRYHDGSSLTREAVNQAMTRRAAGNHQSASWFDGNSGTDVRKHHQQGQMYRATSSNSLMQPFSSSSSAAGRNRHDADHKHDNNDSRALEASRRIYSKNLSAHSDAGFQSDDNIWTSRLRTYPNSTIDKYGRRVANHGVKIELDTVGVDYRIVRPNRTRMDSADGLLEESSRRVSGAETLDDDDRLMPLHKRVNQNDNHLSTRMKASKIYGSLPDCRPHGGSILKKSNGVYSDDSGGGTYSRNSGTLTSSGRPRRGSHRSNQPSRRVLFNNDVDVYRFDSEDSACSSSECERLNVEPVERRRLMTRHRPSASAFVKGKQSNGGMGARTQSLDDITSPETTRRWWLPGKKKDTNQLQKNRAISISNQLGSLALDSKPKRTASVGDLTEKEENRFHDNIQPLSASVYYNPRSNQHANSSSNSKLSIVERASTPGPSVAKSELNRYKNLLPNISNSISDSLPEEPKIRKMAVTAAASTTTSTSVQADTSSKLHRILTNSQFVPSTDTTDGGSSPSSIEMRTSTPGPGDPSHQRSSSASNRSSMEGPILSRMHNLTAASSVASNSLTRKPPLPSTHRSDPNGYQHVNPHRLSDSSYSSSGYNSDTLGWASKHETHTDRSRDSLSKKDSPPLLLQSSPQGSRNLSLQDRNNQTGHQRIPEGHSADKQKQSKAVTSTAGVQYALVTESGSSKKRLVTTVELSDLRLTPKDIRVKSNKSGNVMHVIAAGVDDSGSVDQRLSLPVHVDPYKITAKLDSSHRLVIEAPVVE